MATVGDWISLLDSMFPPAWAEPWDNPGLQAGDRAASVDRVLIALDPAIEVILEAKDRGAQLIIVHHPLVFEPLSSLDLGRPVAAAVAEALKAEIAVVACHTNADVASPGVSDALAERIGVAVGGPLVPSGAAGRSKVVTFVPIEATSAVIEAMAKAGAGVIGNYDVCSFRVRGTGTFRPGPEANPDRGEKQAVNEVEEDRVELAVPHERLAGVVDALLEAHPYEEAAYDVYELQRPPRGAVGLGRGGSLAEPVTVGDLRSRCEETLGGSARLAGDPEAEVSAVAVCGGSGASLIPALAGTGFDAYVTGDVKHHEALEARAAGLAVVDAGHFATEWPWVEDLAARLQQDGPGDAEIALSTNRTDPWKR
ncbi:MAG: Nif3-like dinuclear metal center hexameric protein [Actinomycetota bacterium]